MIRYLNQSRSIIERCYYFAKEDAATELWSERALDFVSGVIEQTVANETRAIEVAFTSQAKATCENAQELAASTEELVKEYAKLRETHGELIHVATTQRLTLLALEKAALEKTLGGRLQMLAAALRNFFRAVGQEVRKL